MDCVNADPELDLQVIVSGEAVLPKYGKIAQTIKYDKSLFYLVEGETPLTMAKSTGLALTEYTTALDELKPDVVVIVGDRWDTLAIAIAASYMNIPVAHIEGGETSGSIDESIRHSITKLSHIHFPATKAASYRVINLGEKFSSVHTVGATSLDVVGSINLYCLDDIRRLHKTQGVGGEINYDEDYIVVLYHPVTTEYNEVYSQGVKLCDAVIRSGIQCVWIWPHSDAGSDGISKSIRELRERINYNYPLTLFKGLPIELYLPLIFNSTCLVGNSSSGIREAGYLGIPVVNIGTRQKSRERGENVLDVSCEELDIYDGIMKQLKHGKYDPCYIYVNGDSGKKIVEVLKNTKIDVQK